jgi:hypothetical protein
VTAIHDAWDAAVHLHSRATETVIAPEPPAGPKDVDTPVTAAWHRVAGAGPVTLVDVEVELPHAIAPREEATTNTTAAE